MSLHTLAHHLQKTGRNGDNMLVHMTSDEVGGLQDLARYMGKSLTINPHTGLPEANIFSQAWKAIKPFAPMIAGAALAPLTAGTSLAFLGTPLAAGALVGGGTALATGSLEKGLMAGLGAYGGAGIGAGLTAAGTDAAAANAVKGMIDPATGALASGITPEAYAAAAQGASSAAATSPFSTAMQGLQSLGAQGGRAAFMGGLGSVPNAGQAAFGSMMMQPVGKPPKGVKDPALIRPYQYTRELTPEASAPIGKVWEGPVSSKEIDYFNEKMTPMQPYFAPGPEYDKKKNKKGGFSDLFSKIPELSGQTTTQMPGMYNPLGQQIDPVTGKPINPYTGAPAYAIGGPVEQMSAENAIGGNMMYPQSQIQSSTYSNPMVQRPMPTNVITQGLNTPVDPYSGEQRFAEGGVSDLRLPAPNPKMQAVAAARAKMQTRQGLLETQKAARDGDYAAQLALQNAGYNMNQLNQYASGGISHLGDYSDGGQLLKGLGDGVSDSIPATIAGKQPARLADNEFVIPARIVSEIGNGSTDAGARKLYAMMDRVQQRRRKTIGKGKVAVDSGAYKELNRL